MSSTIPETRPETHPETVTRLQREAGRSAKPDFSSPVAGDQVRIPVPALPRHEDNQSDARMLAEDAAGLCRHWRTADDLQLAQAKALASIALSMAFGGAK